MRIFDTQSGVKKLEELGFSERNLKLVKNALERPYGLILITGPTGSGKSTTLASMIDVVNTNRDCHIVTIEDPVEYLHYHKKSIVTQREVGNDTKSFADALRRVLRQDPDVILVGEVRDLETAQICIRSALTGHLVLSTLHTNDAASATSRMIDIGIDSYLLAPSLLLVVAQRLMRKLCPDCKEAYEPTQEQIKKLKLNAELIYKAKGCENCNQLGYRGRICIGEIMLASPEVQELINQRASTVKRKEGARASGMQTLSESAIRKVEAGITSLEEALSVTIGED